MNYKFSMNHNASGLALHIHICKAVGENDTWHTFEMTSDELDELRRILGVGMGDCDHCEELEELKRFYAEGRIVLKEDVAAYRAFMEEGRVISHDMKRLTEHELWLKGHSISLEQIRDQQDIHTAGITALGNRINDVARNTTSHLKRLEAGQEGLESTCQIRWGQIQDLKKEVEILRLALFTVNQRAEEDRNRGQSKLKSSK